MAAPPPDEASAHVLDAAERVFLERGFAGTRMRDLADAVGVRPPSLYHHAPGGKAELWGRVVDRALRRHEAGLRAAAGGADGLRAQLAAMAGWLLSQPPVNVVAVATSEMGTADVADARDLSERVYRALMVPVADVFREAAGRGELRDGPTADLLAGLFVAAVGGLAPAERAGSLPAPAAALAEQVVGVVLDGARAGREPG